jgi:pyruvate,water dikinase
LTNIYEPIELKEKVKRRLEIFKKYENVLPPKFLIGLKEFDDVQQYDDECDIYEGIPASYGIITGPVHIINNISQISTVQSGEILIVPRTDPGWTPIFSKIGGLITETGGILSHGAVISREYGIPAVTNIPNATKIFCNNQIISLNGYNGIIKIKKE